jgi:hypothetical protein
MVGGEVLGFGLGFFVGLVGCDVCTVTPDGLVDSE